nr:phostensin [Misgurnus anguillicaudatus]
MMSLSTLPEWKQLLLERKRREEEERERREREEEERLANMPAWKRGIILRRRAKQDEGRDKDGGQHTAEVLTIIEDIATEQMDNKLTLHLQTQETIGSIQHNPFIRSENSWRRDNTCDGTNNIGREKEAEVKREREFWKRRDREIWTDKGREKEPLKKCREVESSTCLFTPVTGLHTIKANNIIIIEKEKNSKERPERRESAREEVEEKRMRMDLREFLAGGGSVTEIRASEVLIIKPPVTDEEIDTPEVREKIWRKETLMTRITKLKGGGTECGGRVSQLLSKFGEHPKPPMRSKSTDCFDPSGKNRIKYGTGDLYVRKDEEDQTRQTFRGVPKRSFSFSDRVLCHQENRVCEEEPEFKVIERTYSDRRVKPNVKVRSEGEPRVTRRWGRHRRDEEVQMNEKRQKESADGEEGFIVAPIKNPEDIAFARRVPIKNEGRESSEREMKIDKEIQRDQRCEIRPNEKEKIERKSQTEEVKRKGNQDEVNVVHSTYIQPSDDIKDIIKPSADRSLQSSSHLSEDLDHRTERVQTDRELNRTGKMSSCEDPDTITYNHQKTSHPIKEEVTIPRTVFYGVDVSSARRTSFPVGDGEGGGVERRESWKTGRPLTRVESLRERIRQQEEKLSGVKKTEVMESRETEGTLTQQEETTLQTLRLFDVTQEVTVASPQLPVPISLSRSDSTEREVGEISGDESESDIFRGETERDHVEECDRRSIWRRQNIDAGEDEKERELLEEEYLPPSLSPSPPLSDSLVEMSRIYNLKPVGSRSAVCIGERKADLSTGQYKSIRNAQSPDILPEKAKLWSYGRDGDKPGTVESTGVQTVQRQVERLKLKEQEGDGETQSAMTSQEVKTAEGQKRPDILKETQKSQTSLNPPQQNDQRSHPKPQQLRSFTVNARTVQPTENSLSTPEQVNSPSSPSTGPSPPLFTIRSASGGPAKRGTTITITPRRSAGSAPSGNTSTITPSKPAPQAQTSTNNTSANKDTGKKRYPTAEEIQVIGGYQNLERSCLIKNKGTAKAVKVCFDDAQLERVCEYPSEDSHPCAPHPMPEDGRCGGEQEEEEEEENGAFVSSSDRSSGRIRFLKVDESCKR